MKRILKVLPIILIVCMFFTSVMASNLTNVDKIYNKATYVGTDFNFGGNEAKEVSSVAANIWSTIIVIVRILAIAAVVFAGIRYMFASADQKADIKKSMGILVVGALLVFGATYLLEALGGASSTLFK